MDTQNMAEIKQITADATGYIQRMVDNEGHEVTAVVIGIIYAAAFSLTHECVTTNRSVKMMREIFSDLTESALQDCFPHCGERIH